jgi:hypothetical protein
LEDEKERPRLPLTLLSRRKGVLGTAARPWRRKPAGGTIFPKPKLDLHAIAALALQFINEPSEPCFLSPMGLSWAL